MKKDQKNYLDARISLEVLCLANKKMIKKKKKKTITMPVFQGKKERSHIDL